MAQTLKTRPARSSDIEEICSVVEKAFDEFIAPGYSEEGVAAFKQYANASALAERFNNPELVAYVALCSAQIVGYIEMRDHSHISLLAVDSGFHRQGIARRLWTLAQSAVLEKYPDSAAFTVNSSPFAVPVYKRLGFVPVDEEQVKNGIRFIPMQKD